LTKEVKVPVPPEPCVVPAFHVQAPCNDPATEVECLLGEFALTLQVEHNVAVILKTCPGISQK